MQYDANGYPVKPQHQHHSVDRGAAGGYSPSDGSRGPTNEADLTAASRYSDERERQGTDTLNATNTAEQDFRSFPPSYATAQSSSPPHTYHQAREAAVRQPPLQPHPLVYDEDGHPVKPPLARQQQHQRQQTAQQQYEARQGPIYDAEGNPIKVVNNAHIAMTGMRLNNDSTNQREFASSNGPHTSSALPVRAGGMARPQTDGTDGGGFPQFVSAQDLPQRQHWSTTFCDLFSDCNIFWETMFCFYCQEGRIYNAINLNRPDDCDGGICALSFCLAVCFGLHWMVDLYNRRELIDKYRLGDEEGVVTSCCLTCCCASISSCQMQRELKARGINPGGQCCISYKKEEQSAHATHSQHTAQEAPPRSVSYSPRAIGASATSNAGPAAGSFVRNPPPLNSSSSYEMRSFPPSSTAVGTVVVAQPRQMGDESR